MKEGKGRERFWAGLGWAGALGLPPPGPPPPPLLLPPPPWLLVVLAIYLNCLLPTQV
jgi:hypothetical protein